MVLDLVVLLVKEFEFFFYVKKGFEFFWKFVNNYWFVVLGGGGDVEG